MRWQMKAYNKPRGKEWEDGYDRIFNKKKEDEEEQQEDSNN